MKSRGITKLILKYALTIKIEIFHKDLEVKSEINKIIVSVWISFYFKAYSIEEENSLGKRADWTKAITKIRPY